MPNGILPRVDKATAVVIFGATGALAGRKLFPALGKLHRERMLPEGVRLIGVAREDLSHEAFRETVATSLADHLDGIDPSDEQLLSNAHYVSGDLNTDDWVAELRYELERCESEGFARTIFYLAIAPSLFGAVIKTLGEAKLSRHGNVSLIVEKPFGHDLASAKQLDRILAKYFSEKQVYRMDHYLGKDTVQNILALRFENGLFEPIWNHHYIDHVQITLAEDGGIGNRAAYYEEAGALRDVVQNHLLQLLAHIAMEPPKNLAADTLRTRRATVLENLRPLKPAEIDARVVRGQYGAGRDFMGKDVPAYRGEKGVAKDSATETFAALPVEIMTDRWIGVPFYLRAGKRLPKPVTEITMQFKPSGHDLYGRGQTANLLTLRIQPNEGIAFRLFIKKPGYANELEEVDMSFCYRDSFREKLPEAYDRLLLDCLLEDQSLFMRSDEIESAWQYVDPILKRWQKAKAPRFPNYDAGSWGPRAADDLMKADGRSWWSDVLDVCPVPGAGQAIMKEG